MDEQKPTDSTGEIQIVRPGDTIAPASEPAPIAPSPAPVPTAPESPVPAPPMASTAAPEQIPDQPPAPDQTPYAAPTPQDIPETDPGVISWTASEFIAHDKSVAWYALLAVASVVVAALVYLFTRDKISTGVVLVAGAALGVYGARKPQQQQYQLNEQGIAIGPKFYGFNEFRSFAILDEGAFSSISFMPLARFGQLVTIYFDPQDEDEIVDILATRLPLEQRDHDVVDRFMKRIRF